MCKVFGACLYKVAHNQHFSSFRLLHSKPLGVYNGKVHVTLKTSMRAVGGDSEAIDAGIIWWEFLSVSLSGRNLMEGQRGYTV